MEVEGVFGGLKITQKYLNYFHNTVGSQIMEEYDTMGIRIANIGIVNLSE